MISNNYFNQDCAVFTQRLMHPETDPYAYMDAANLFGRVRRKVAFEKAWNWLRGRQTEHLMDLDEVKAHIKVTNSHYCGLHEVPLSQIRGTQGRARDFDAQFRPMTARMKERWLSIAAVWYQGLGMPAVELVKIGSYYFVLDGNHRVSAARAMGNVEIDAEVIEWQVAGRLPWEQESCAMIGQASAAV